MMKDKVCVVTGSTSGIGRETVLALAARGATLVAVARSADKARALVDEVVSKTGNDRIHTPLADLSSMAQVRELGATVLQRHERIDVLVNNAGAMFSRRRLTSEGYERTFALNHMSYFVLTHQLLPALRAAGAARIVNVASDAHKNGVIAWDDLHLEAYGSSGFKAYGQSKLMNVMFTFELARRLEGTGVTVNAVHPGYVHTGFGKNNGGLWRGMLTVFGSLGGRSPAKGAQTVIHAASSPQMEGTTGRYLKDLRDHPTSDLARDEASWTRLWNVSREHADRV